MNDRVTPEHGRQLQQYTEYASDPKPQVKGKPLRVMLEMRPALDGFAGIPQEVRLLFRGLCQIDTIEIEGMMQHSHRSLARGTKKRGILGRWQSEARRINRFSQVIISLAERPYRNIIEKMLDYSEKKLSTARLMLRTMLGFGSVELTRFESKHFRDFTWRTMFAKTLPASDFEAVSGINHRVCSTPWQTMHMVGLQTLNFGSSPKYPTLKTEGVDIFIGQTPYPGRVPKSTRMVVRYHDAIPVLMPHTISDKSLHQATHFYALMDNVRNGAWFACVSEASRQDLLRLFPEASDRTVTIHNMVAHHYFREDSSFGRVQNIIRSRLYEGDETKGIKLLPDFLSLREKESFYKRNVGNPDFKYLLVVSTIEPRKNHTRLLAAWEVIKADIDPAIKLVVVGTLGWDNKAITSSFRPWIDRGDLFMLNAVPAPDLRVLYRHALATVCPSLGEGFDFSGVESMASGGVTIASDIPVHREVYDDAAEYFDPYATMSLVKALKKVLYDADAQQACERLRQRGADVAARYQPDRILPRWEKFLALVAADGKEAR